MASSTSSVDADRQSKKIFVKEIGPPPEDPVCDSGIYCYGPLLEAVQMSELYPDSKTFVDKRLKFPPGKIIKNFQDLLNKQNGSPLSLEQVKSFVEENFDAEGTELETWLPEDWTAEPEFISHLRKPALKGLARRINRLWKDLSRKIKDEVRENPNLYSIIYVPNGFIVPGGRFREFYYWDTYWIVRALLHCDMAQTVRGIIDNFLTMVKTYGLVPNGGRIYYLKRSQPPFLTLMMKEYWDKTNDVQFIRANLSTLETELEFWEMRRSIDLHVDGKDRVLFRYATGGTGPRPESYREDVEMGEMFDDPTDREAFYFHMKAGAESGWDYSTRWMINKQGGNDGDLRDVKTNYIIPVDLNCIIYLNYTCISEFYSVLGDTIKSEIYAHKARTLAEAIESVLWNESEKMWFDFDVLNNRQRNYFYPSNLFPLWAECYDVTRREEVAKSAIDYLNKTGAIRCKGGVPTSMNESGQQWDFPNAWPPLQHILVAGLLKTGDSDAHKMALNIARRYTKGTMFSCPDDAQVCNMFEKYNVNETGSAGGGGEYDVQTGFGWTNGVVIDFMVTFGDQLLTEDESDDKFDVELTTQFDVSRGKSSMTRKESTQKPPEIFLVSPEKHELEQSEKNLFVHPALEIEEDEPKRFLDSDEKSKKRKKRKKISSINGDVYLDRSGSMSSLEALEKATHVLDNILELHDEEEEPEPELDRSVSSRSEKRAGSARLDHGSRSHRIKNGSGSYQMDNGSRIDLADSGLGSSFHMKSGSLTNLTENSSGSFRYKHGSGSSRAEVDSMIVKPQNETDELVVHFVSNEEKFEDPARRNFNRNQEETISIRLKGNDVNVILMDSFGKEVPVTDVDLELELPARFRSHSRLKSRIRHLIQRLKNLGYVNNKDISKCPDTEKSVMYIKDRMRVRDSSGKEFDIEMDLKLEIQPAKFEHQHNEEFPMNRFMCPISMPWKNVWAKKQVENEKVLNKSEAPCQYNTPASSSLNSMDQLKLLEIDNNNYDSEADERIWNIDRSDKVPSHKSSLADLFKYTPV